MIDLIGNFKDYSIVQELFTEALFASQAALKEGRITPAEFHRRHIWLDQKFSRAGTARRQRLACKTIIRVSKA